MRREGAEGEVRCYKFIRVVRGFQNEPRWRNQPLTFLDKPHRHTRTLEVRLSTNMYVIDDNVWWHSSQWQLTSYLCRYTLSFHPSQSLSPSRPAAHMFSQCFSVQTKVVEIPHLVGAWHILVLCRDVDKPAEWGRRKYCLNPPPIKKSLRVVFSFFPIIFVSQIQSEGNRTRARKLHQS